MLPCSIRSLLAGWALCMCLTLLGALKASAQYVTYDSVAIPKPHRYVPPDSTIKVIKGKHGIPLKGADGQDSVIFLAKHIPRLATIRSAMVPGWGQWYNHKYWKVPIVYGALVTCVVVFEFNIQQYKLYRHAYQVLGSNLDTSAAALATVPTWLQAFTPESIQYARNQAREYVDYSVLAFIIAWGLNVVDATIDAHLRDFDVSDDLSLRLAPPTNISLFGGGSVAGLGIVMDIHPPKKKPNPFLANPY